MKTTTSRRGKTQKPSLAPMPAGSMFPILRRIGQAFALRIRKWGLPDNIGYVLAHTHMHRSKSEPSEIAAALFLPRQTMTFILDTMGNEGLAVRKPHPKDRRRVLIRLTRKGRKLSQSIFQDLFALEKAAIKSMKGVEASAFRSFLKRYADALSAENKRYFQTRKE